MNEQDLSLIEQYYRNELSEAERLAFEKRLGEEPELREEALLHARAIEAIRLHGRDLFKKRLGERPLVKPARPYWLWPSVVAALAILAFVFFYTQRKKAQHLNTSPNATTIDSLQQQKPTAFPPDTSKQPPQTHTPQASHQPRDRQNQYADRLFATVFERHEDAITRDAGVRGKKRGNSSPATFQTFLYYYQNKQYPEALSAFESLPEAEKNDENHLFYYANALLASGKANRASLLFDDIAYRDSSDFTTEALWYSALCALKAGDLPKAKDRLEMVISSNSKTYKPKAEALLGQLPQ